MARQGAGQADARAGEEEPGPGTGARQHEGAVCHGALTLLVTVLEEAVPVGTMGQGGRRPHPISPMDTMDQALPLWLTRSVPACAPNCPQSLQPGMGPGVAPGGPGQRNRRNNVPMRTSAFYFLPTMFSWQTRHSHDRGLGSKPRGQCDRHQRNAEVNTSTASGTPRHTGWHLPPARTPSSALGGFGARCPQGSAPQWMGAQGCRASPAAACPPWPFAPAPRWRC